MKLKVSIKALFWTLSCKLLSISSGEKEFHICRLSNLDNLEGLKPSCTGVESGIIVRNYWQWKGDADDDDDEISCTLSSCKDSTLFDSELSYISF